MCGSGIQLPCLDSEGYSVYFPFSSRIKNLTDFRHKKTAKGGTDADRPASELRTHIWKVGEKHEHAGKVGVNYGLGIAVTSLN
jgi:hypothetical protein